MIHKQEQQWSEYNRLLLYDTEGASVQIDIIHEPADLFNGAMKEVTAYIYALYVDEPNRRKGKATEMLAAAEAEIKARGHKYCHLYWSESDTPRGVLDWYYERGYDDVAVNRRTVFLRKKLTD